VALSLVEDTLVVRIDMFVKAENGSLLPFYLNNMLMTGEGW